ncbi:unnamed protein product [Arabidopsis halleri]
MARSKFILGVSIYSDRISFLVGEFPITWWFVLCSLQPSKFKLDPYP